MTGKWYLRRLVPLVSFIISFAILIGGASWLWEYHPEMDRLAAGLVFLLISLICGLLWLLLTQIARLHQSRENLRLTIESSTDIVVLLDSKARYVEIFSASDERLVATRDQMIGRSVKAVMGDEIGDRVEVAVSEVIASGGKKTMSYSISIAGHALWFEAVISKRDEKTVVAMIRDVTIQESFSQKFEDQRRFMETILNSIPDPIFLKDEQHRWLYGNDAFSTILGKQRSEYYGKRDNDFYPPEISDIFFKSDDDTFASMREVEREEIILTPNAVLAESRTILTKKTPFIGADGTKSLVGIIRDITDRKQMERQLQEERARQVAASRLASLGEMAGGVAHEINNPLAIIAGYAGRLLDILNTEPLVKSQALDFVNRIEKTAMRIATIVKGLRAISRDGSYDPKERITVEAIVEDTLGLCAERFRINGVSLETKIEPKLFLHCRSVQISQVLLNLLTNAFSAASQSPEARILIEARSSGSSVEISVTDSGHGVDAKIRERIFEPFFTTKPVGVGTGLGLSIVATIVREHDGEVFLDSNSKQSRFVIRLPMAGADQVVADPAADSAGARPVQRV